MLEAENYQFPSQPKVIYPMKIRKEAIDCTVLCLEKPFISCSSYLGSDTQPNNNKY